MLPIVAYTDKLTVAPGEALTVMASSFGARTYHADLRRIIQGDTNPEGPGYKDEAIALDLGGERHAVAKAFKPGSAVIIPGHEALKGLGSFTLAAVIQPTLTTGKERLVIALPGFASLGIDAGGHLVGRLGQAEVRSAAPLTVWQWQIVSLAYDAASRELVLSSLAAPGTAATETVPLGGARWGLRRR